LVLCVPWRTLHNIVRVHSVVGPGTIHILDKNKIDAQRDGGVFGESNELHGSGSVRPGSTLTGVRMAGAYPVDDFRNAWTTLLLFVLAVYMFQRSNNHK
jgi:hypothetical protein